MRAIDLLQVCCVNRLKLTLNGKADRKLRGEFHSVQDAGPYTQQNQKCPLSHKQSNHIPVMWSHGIPVIAVTTTELIRLCDNSHPFSDN